MKATPETRVNSPDSDLVQKYESWLDSIQEPVINIMKILVEVYGTDLNITLRDSKMMPNDIRETLLRAYDLLVNFRNEIKKKTREVYELREEIKRLDELLHQEEQEFTHKIMQLETSIGRFDRIKESPSKITETIIRGK